MIELARSMKLPLLATNGVRHATPEERELFDALTAVHHKTTVMEAGRLLARNSERYLKIPAHDGAHCFRDVPEADRGNSGAVAAARFHARRSGL